MKKAILIDAYSREVKEVEYQTLEDIYRLLRCSIIEAVYLSNGDVIYIDEEGRINGTKVGFSSVQKGPLFGSGLVVHINDEGDDVAPHSTVEQVSQEVQFGDRIEEILSTQSMSR